MRPVYKVMEDLGVTEHGKVQQYLTERVLFRMRRYMPWLTGLTASSLTSATSPTTIEVNAPYARYLYNGKAPSGRDLNYTKTPNALAGPHWDRTLAQNEGAAIAREVEEYARSLR
ncbi:MAG: hypothetical protein HFJ75_07760 [Eggerthellaceae bacterium]|nr:hypothetical protein [Eggerthellaceae bacterium]